MGRELTDAERGAYRKAPAEVLAAIASATTHGTIFSLDDFSVRGPVRPDHVDDLFPGEVVIPDDPAIDAPFLKAVQLGWTRSAAGRWWAGERTTNGDRWMRVVGATAWRPVQHRGQPDECIQMRTEADALRQALEWEESRAAPAYDLEIRVDLADIERRISSVPARLSDIDRLQAQIDALGEVVTPGTWTSADGRRTVSREGDEFKYMVDLTGNGPHVAGKTGTFLEAVIASRKALSGVR